jgi:3-phenylpropionate/trans-cinnamate dioxygenase ferredoxin reductase component
MSATTSEGTTSTRHSDVLIVGAGHGGAHAAIALRHLMFTGTITVVGDDAALPYERPPLSKDYLSGERDFDRMHFRPLQFWTEHAVTLLKGQAVAVDAARNTVSLGDHRVLHYGALIWAAGAGARRITCPGHDLQGIHSLRSKVDADAIRQSLPSVKQVVIIGGGYIGLESAASLRKLGYAVTVVETQDRVLARVAAEPISRFYESEHRRHGVELMLGASIDRFEGKAGKVQAVLLAGGGRLPADLVIVGIGITPNVAPVMQAGATGQDGIDVDEHCRSSLENIYAIGDCAMQVSPFAEGQRVRIESVHNATEMARVVARAITGAEPVARTPPWFWSNQYDLRLQTVGLNRGYDKVLIRGEPATHSFSVIYLRKGRVIALDCVNATRDYTQGHALVQRGAEIDTAKAVDAGIALKNAVPGIAN